MKNKTKKKEKPQIHVILHPINTIMQRQKAVHHPLNTIQGKHSATFISRYGDPAKD